MKEDSTRQELVASATHSTFEDEENNTTTPPQNLTVLTDEDESLEKFPCYHHHSRPCRIGLFLLFIVLLVLCVGGFLLGSQQSWLQPDEEGSLSLQGTQKGIHGTTSTTQEEPQQDPAIPAQSTTTAPTLSPSTPIVLQATSSPVVLHVTETPTSAPTFLRVPSLSPSVLATTGQPTAAPTISPTTALPSSNPSNVNLGTTTASPSRTAPTTVPTRGPTLTSAPTDSTVESFRVMLQPVSLTPDALENVDSPEYAALTLLADTTNNDDDNSLDGLVQGYAMLALELSLRGANAAATTDMSRIVHQDECQWPGVTCTIQPVNTTASSSRTLHPVVTKLVGARRSLTGTITPEIGLLRNLTYLDLGENQIQGVLPSSIYQLTSLEYLYLHQNQLTGPISEDIAQLDSLINLYLNENQLTGTFPRGLGSPRRTERRPLRYLNLYQNQLHGTLPNNLGLRSLSYLDLGHNDFSGPIPEDWCTGQDSFRRLRHLYLDHNGFNGSLPQDFTQIGGGRLNQLNVQDNELTGVVPGDWDPITMLVTLEVQSNEFSGFGKNLCKLSVFHSGELASLRAPCDICSCGQPLCDQSICTPS